MDYDQFIEALSKGKAWDEFEKERVSAQLGDFRLSDFARYPQGQTAVPPKGETWREGHPLAGDGTQPTQLAAAVSKGNPGFVLDPNYRAEEGLYPQPTEEQQNRGLEKFHDKTPAADRPLNEIGDIDEFWRRQAARYFTG